MTILPAPRTHARPPSDRRSFADYAHAGFQCDLLPIAHPATPISPSSGLKREKIGKIPALMRANGCVGFHNWTAHVTSPQDVKLYDTWRSQSDCPWGIGIQGRATPAVDIDVDDPHHAESFHLVVLMALGATLCRRVASAKTGELGPRRLLPYRSNAPLHPWSIAFEIEGRRHMVELKASGQQWVAEGVHPRGGEYTWVDGQSPAHIGHTQLIELSERESEALQLAIMAHVRGLGGTVLESSSRRSAGSLVPLQEDLLAPSLKDLRAAIAAIPNDLPREDWIRALAAIKGAAGKDAEAIYPVAEDWCLQWEQNTPDDIRATWNSLRAPYRVGWSFISRLAKSASGGAYRPPSDFDDTVVTDIRDNDRAAAALAMFERYVWIHNVSQPLDLHTGELLRREQFNAANYRIGDPASTKNSAWAVFLRNGDYREVAQGLTFRPDRPLRLVEDLAGLAGPCINTWRSPPPLDPAPVTDDEVRIWLDHAEYLMPSLEEREAVLNWLAWVVQNQSEKPNFALVLGSTYEGVGKDMFLEPLRTAVGSRYVRELKPHELTSRFTGHLRETKLLIVQEMHSFERREMANLLKPLLASPPDTLTIELKGRDGYAVPNIVAAVFCTNEANALAIDATGRRYLVAWCDAPPRPPADYSALHSWLHEHGGKELAARFLMQRDVSRFDAKGRAPASASREGMRRAGRSKLEEFIEDGITNRDYPLEADLISLEDLRLSLPSDVFGKHGRPSSETLAGLLRKQGAIRIDKLALGGPPPTVSAPLGYAREAVVYAVRNGAAYADLAKDELRALYWTQRAARVSGGVDDAD